MHFFGWIIRSVRRNIDQQFHIMFQFEIGMFFVRARFFIRRQYDVISILRGSWPLFGADPPLYIVGPTPIRRRPCSYEFINSKCHKNIFEIRVKNQIYSTIGEVLIFLHKNFNSDCYIVIKCTRNCDTYP